WSDREAGAGGVRARRAAGGRWPHGAAAPGGVRRAPAAALRPGPPAAPRRPRRWASPGTRAGRRRARAAGRARPQYPPKPAPNCRCRRKTVARPSITCSIGYHGGMPQRSRIALGFAIIYLLWGGTFLAIKIGDQTLPPLVLA